MPHRTPRFNIAGPPPPKVNLGNAGHYDSNWRKLRKRRLDGEPLCRPCTQAGYVTPAVEVDHIIPKALGGRDEWDNTQSICSSCHKAKTRKDVERVRRGW